MDGIHRLGVPDHRKTQVQQLSEDCLRSLFLSTINLDVDLFVIEASQPSNGAAFQGWSDICPNKVLVFVLATVFARRYHVPVLRFAFVWTHCPRITLA